MLRAAEATSASRPQAALAAEGRRLFNSTTVAKAGESCGGCHIGGGGTNPDLGTIVHPQKEGDFTGPRDVPVPVGRRPTPRRTAGRARSRVWAASPSGRSSRTSRAATSSPTAKTAGQVAALVAYLDTLKPPVSAFDQGTLSASARRGEDLFQGKGGCIGCHSGPLLTDNALHDTLVPKVSDGDTDTGAATSGPLRGSFNTPQMRDLRNTAPYMHNGSLKTLRDVVEFYDQRSSIAPLKLTNQEIEDLVAYLQTL